MINWIITSCVLILVIMALRYILKGKISLRLQYALWGLVLLRLLIPFSIGNSSISVLNVTDKVTEQFEQQKQQEEFIGTGDTSASEDISASGNTENRGEVIDSGKTDAESVGKYDNIKPSEDIKNPVNDYESKENHEHAGGSKLDSIVPNTPGESVPVTDGTVIEELPIEEPDEDVITFAKAATIVKDIALYVWIAGMVLASGYLLAVNIRFTFLLRKNRKLLEGKNEYSLSVYITEYVDTPCMHGIFKPGIYVTPEALKSEQVLKHVLEHESTHYRHGDHIWCLLRGIALVIHWYNPFVWLAAVLSRNDSELACDEATIKRIGESERAEYGRTLIGMTCQKRSALFVNATTMTGSKKSIKERIVLIAKKPKMALYTFITVVVIAAIAVGCTFTGAGKDDTTVSQSGEENSGDEQETTTPEEQPTSSGDEKETTDNTEETSDKENSLGTFTWRVEGDTIIISGTGTLTEGKWYKEEFKHLIIEEGITDIDDKTFWKADKIESIVIPGSIKTVGNFDCVNLKEVILKEGVEVIEEGAFSGCTKLEKVVIPSSVTAIGGIAFEGCSSLIDIEFPKTSIDFGDEVFHETKWVEEKRKENALVIVNDTLIDARSAVGEVVVPEGIRVINEFAFALDSQVTSVVLPTSLESVDFRAFYGNDTIESVTFAGGNYIIETDAFGGCSNLKEVNFSEGLISIGFEAFYVCKSLEKIVFPKSLESLGRRAFEACTALKEVVIPEGFTGFEGDVFARTAWLKEKQAENPFVVVNGVLIDASTASGKVVVPMGVKCIAENAFFSNTYLEGTINAELVVDVVLSDSVTTIKDGAFSNCYSMKRITIPENVVSIGEYAFDLEGLKTINGKKGSYAEVYAKEKSIAFEPVLTYKWRIEGDTLIISGTGIIDDGAWQYENFKNVIIEEGIEGIDCFTFHDCKNIESLVIPSTLKRVWGFAGCTNLKSITIADGVEQIDECAFERCQSLEKIVIPDSVKGISLWAFAGCISLKEVVFEGTVPGIDPYAFEGTPWFEAKKAEGPFVIIEGTIIRVNNELVSGDVVIPDGITYINEIAFTGNQKITSVTFPKGFVGIGENAFSGCDNLTKLIFKGSLSYIAWGAFSGCGGLMEVVLPEGTEKIGMEAFWGCKKLERVVMPDTVTSIGAAAFEQCENLKDIVISKNCFDFGEYAFSATQWLHDRRAENPLVKVNGVIIDSKIVILKDINLSDEIFTFYKNADGISMTLYTAEGGKYNTYTKMNNKSSLYESANEYKLRVASNAVAKLEHYKWVQMVGMDDYLREYWIEIKPIGGVENINGGTESITVYHDGAGIIKYFDGTDYSYWVAERQDNGWHSYAEDIHGDYSGMDYDASRYFEFDGSANEVAEYFVSTAYSDFKMNKLTPGSKSAYTFYELIEYKVLEISEDGTEVFGEFRYAFDVDGAEEDSSYYLAGDGEFGEGKYEGKYIQNSPFSLFKQENGLWKFSLMGGLNSE